MTVESASDILAMFSDAAVTFTYKSRGTRYVMRGIFDNDYLDVDIDEADYASSQPRIMLPTSVLPCEPAAGDKVYYDGEVYIVRNFEDDGTGVTVLVLEVTTDLDAP